MIFSGRGSEREGCRPPWPWPSFRYAPDLNGSLDRRRSRRISPAIIIRGNFEWRDPSAPTATAAFDTF